MPTSLADRGAICLVLILLPTVATVAVVGIWTAAAAVPNSPDVVPAAATTTADPGEPATTELTTTTEAPTTAQTSIATGTPTTATTVATPTTSAPSSPGEATTSSPGSVVPTGTTSVPTPQVDTPTTAPARQPATRPAVQESDISLTTAALAIVALVVTGTALLVLHRVDPGQPARAALKAESQPGADAMAATAALLVVLGDAMIDSGYTVTQVQTTLRRVLDVSGIPDGEVIVLPTAVFVSVPGQATAETALAAVGLSSLRLDQVEAVSRVVTAAENGEINPTDARVALARVRSQAPPFGSVVRTIGYAVFSAGLALILSGGVADVMVAAALGAVVGTIQLAVAESGAATRAFLPVLCAFLVSTTVFVLGRYSADISVLAPLIAPLVTFLPGALLTTAVVELSTGQMISGSGRLAAGLLQLVLLALGIVAGAQLVGVSPVGAIADRPLGDFGPWIGVALFGIGVLVYHCAPRSSFGWILLVLYVAYGAQIIGGLFFGPLLSAFIGALVMSPVASYIALRPSGAPTQVSFLPAFWLLVPGALGLVGLTQLLGENRTDALTSLLSMGTTMIGISFGVLIGLAIGATISRHVTHRALASH